MKSELKSQPLTAAIAAALLAIGSTAALAQDAGTSSSEDANQAGEIETVVVTGARAEQNIEDVAGSISLMTGADLEAQMVTDMSQMFRYEPGVNITGSNGTAQNVIVRGMGGDRVMMIKDGMRMNEGYGADGANDVVGRGFIDMDTVKQVEVAKGAASSLYGADAMGGIVAFVTKDAGDFLRDSDYHVSVNGDYDGRSSTTSLGALGAFRLGGFETLVSYKNRSGNETQNYEDNRQHANVDSDSLLVKSDYVFDEDRVLTLSVDAFQQDVERPDTGEDHGNYVGLPGWTINLQESLEEKESTAYQVRYRDTYSDSLIVDTVDFSVYLNETEQTDQFRMNHDTPEPMGPGGSRDLIKNDLFRQETWGTSLSMSKLLEQDSGSHFLSYGFDWDSTDTNRPREEQRIQSDGTVILDDLSAPFPKNSTDRLGVYLQDSIELGEKLTLVPGVRYDYYSMDPKEDEGYSNAVGDTEVNVAKISDDNVSFRLGAIYDFTDDFSAYFQYAQGFKVPPYDLAYFYFDHLSFTGVGIRIVPADDLVPEESDSYEIGIRGNLGDFGYNLSAYRSDYDNFIQIGYLGSVDEINWDFGFPFPVVVDIFQYQNIDRAEISGLEFRLDYVLGDNMALFLNGEYMDSEDKSTGDQLASIQPFNGTLGFNYYRDKFGFDAMLKWVSDMDKVPEGAMETDSYTTLDLFARYRLNEHFQFSLGLLNAFDEEYIEYTSVAGIPDDGRDLTLYTEPGRTISASLRYAF
jgi:hemoglobin/transferrin/lactoferrin receptor protein